MDIDLDMLSLHSGSIAAHKAMVSASYELQNPCGLVGSEAPEVLLGKKATINKWVLR